MKTISIINQKGGVAKTTTALNLAAYYAGKGFYTLAVDLDPQSNMTEAPWCRSSRRRSRTTGSGSCSTSCARSRPA